MAKDNPEDQTVPVYNADGVLTGWTTPEKAAAIQSGTAENADIWNDSGFTFGITSPSAGSGGEGQLSLGGYVPPSSGGQPILSYDREGGSLEQIHPDLVDRVTGGAAGEGAYANELQKTGYWDDNSKVTLWNPDIGDYQTFDVNPDNIFEFNPRNDVTSWYFNERGEHVLGFKPSQAASAGGGYEPGDKLQTPGSGIWTGGAPIAVAPPPTSPSPSGPTQPPTTSQPPPTTAPPPSSGPTDDWFWTDPPGYENAPQPGGGGEFVEGGPPPDTSWNWDYFREKAPGDRQWGGYDPDYQAFERYQPGMESPWGMPNIEGGNRDFYQQQFVNLLRDEQGFRNRQRAAQLRQQEALENPVEPISSDEMWSWAYGGKGLPDVKLGGGERTSTWELADQFTPGVTTRAEILRWAGSNLGSKEDQEWYRKALADPNAPDADSVYWSTVGDPTKLINQLPTDPKELTRANQRRMTDLFNAIYNQGGAGPYAPTGYASPIQWGGEYNA